MWFSMEETGGVLVPVVAIAVVQRGFLAQEAR